MALLFLEFLGALLVLLTSARFFTVSAENLGNWLRLPPFVTGIFIVGVGTSLPEMVTGIIAVSKNHSEIVPGNIIGSNVSNLLLLLGVAMLVTGKDIVLGKRYLLIDLHYLVGSSVLVVMFMYDGTITLTEGLIGVVLFFIYSFYLIRTGKEEIEESPQGERLPSPISDVLISLACGLGIYFGAEFTIDAVARIAERLEVPPAIIALTMLSLGTTLPELAVNYFSMKRGKSELAVGNILGSCIFNSLIIPGVATPFGAITVSPQILAFPLWFLPVATLLFYLLTLDKRISFWEGILFITIYIVFVLESIGLGK